LGKCYGKSGSLNDMAKKHPKKKVFSAVKAVKANARERVGQPKPERVIEDAPRDQKRKSKHKTTLEDLLKTEE
jgi:hypothetical protein